MISSELSSDLILLALAFIYVIGLLIIIMILKKKDLITGYIARKIVHLLAGFSIFIVPYMNYPYLALIVSLLFLVVCRVSKPNTPVFEMMAEKDERVLGYLGGPFSYALSINILVLIFSLGNNIRYFYFPANAIMMMMIADTMASIFGRRFGKHFIDLKWTKTIRTIEGSLAFFISAFLLALFGFSFFGVWFPVQIHIMSIPELVTLSLISAICGAIVELLSPSNIDDLTVPIATCFISFLLAYLFFPASIGF